MGMFWIGLIVFASCLHFFDIQRVRHTPILKPSLQAHTAQPFISIIIPARNEAERIGRCLAGLAEQSYRHFEVIVMDDHSTDNTIDCVTAYYGHVPNLRIIHSQELPIGWAGKSWACWQAAQLATGEWLLFLDADVIPSAELLYALADTVKHGDFVSLLPRMLLGTPAECFILPAFLELISTIYRFQQVNRPGSTDSFAIGQCLMIRQSAYKAIDGHRAVRDSVLEDMQLAKRAKQAGFRLLVAEAPDLLAVRMYQDWHSLTEGLAKNAVAGARHAGYRVLWAATHRLIAGWLSVQVFLFAWLTHASVSNVIWWVGGTLLLLQMLVSGWIVVHRFRISVIWGILLPLGTLTYFLIATYGLIRLWLGLGVIWKGRVLQAKD